MDYYFAPLACSLAGHALIVEAGLPVRCIAVSLTSGTCASGESLGALTGKALVPVLRHDDGRLVTENIAVLSVLADLAPAHGYLPPRDTVAGLAALEWLSFTATEVHKLGLYPIFQRSAPEAVRAWSRERLAERLAFADAHLRAHAWLAGEQFTAADAYFGWALMLCPHAGIDLAALPGLQAMWQRLRQRPAFARVMADEQALYRAGA